MTKPPVHQSFIQVQDPERDKQKQKLPAFLSHAAVQRQISTKLCMKIEDVYTIFAPPWFFQSDQ